MGFRYGLVTGEPEFLLTGRIDACSTSSAWPDLLRAPAGADRDSFHKASSKGRKKWCTFREWVIVTFHSVDETEITVA